MKKSMSFKGKIQLMLFCLSLVALGTTGFLAFQFNNAIKADKKDLIAKAAESISDKVDRNLFERYGDVQAFALSEPARSGDVARITKFMADMMAAYAPIYDVMMVLDMKGNVVAANAVDKNNKPLDPSKIIGKNFADQDWFKAAVEGKVAPGAAHVTDLRIDDDVAKFAATDGKVLDFTAPIRDAKSGEVLGVWTNRMSWKDVVDDIVTKESQKLKDEKDPVVAAYLVDQTGTYLLHHDPGQILKAKADGLAGFNGMKLGTWTHTVDDSDLIKASSIETFTTAKGYSSYPPLKWTYILRVPANDSEVFMAVGSSAVGITLILLIALIANSVTSRTGLSLEHVIQKLREGSTHVSKTASEVTGAANELSNASSQQASSLQQTAASIEEINAMIKKSSENSSRSQEVAGQSSQIAKRGRESVAKMSDAINEINVSNEAILAQIGESNNQISEIARVIAEIGNKTKVINDIVFQTKLLSFNASVEAARAGEHGKGFAVVAEEVGNLAQMSGNAAKEISEMLAESIKKVESIVEETKSKVGRLISDGRQKVQSGIVIASECGEVLSEVVANIDELNTMVTEISVAGNEQSQGVNEITKAMNELDHSMHANATTSQNVSGFANGLSSESVQLDAVVRELAVVVTGSDEDTFLSEGEEKAERAVRDVPKSKKGNVVFMKADSKKEAATVRQLQKAAGDVPTSSDPRFKDV